MSRVKQFFIGCAVISFFFSIYIATSALSQLDGTVGLVARTFAGLMSSPFVMEATIFVLGFIILMSFNYIRRQREGDEFVYLEQVDDPAQDLPEHARSAVFSHKPLTPDTDLEFAAIKGALENKDTETAVDLLMQLSDEQKESPAALKLRLQLAELRDDTKQIETLKERLDKTAE